MLPASYLFLPRLQRTRLAPPLDPSIIDAIDGITSRNDCLVKEQERRTRRRLISRREQWGGTLLTLPAFSAPKISLTGQFVFYLGPRQCLTPITANGAIIHETSGNIKFPSSPKFKLPMNGIVQSTNIFQICTSPVETLEIDSIHVFHVWFDDYRQLRAFAQRYHLLTPASIAIFGGGSFHLFALLGD